VIPSLQSLFLSYLYTPEILDYVAIPNLKHLGLVDGPNNTSLTLFLSRSARLLTHLTVEIRDVHHISFPTFLATLPSLETLELNYPDAHADTAPMRYLFLQGKSILPRLRKLRIVDSLRVGAYAAFLQALRSQTHLTHGELHVEAP
jgi:hypothetical protein